VIDSGGLAGGRSVIVAMYIDAMARITVFGAAGRTGQLVLREGRRRGHEMTAFTRRPEGTLEADRVVRGDGRDPDAVRAAVGGAEAVIVIVAAGGRKGPHETADVAKVITSEMTELGVRRLVFTSAYPLVGDRPRLLIGVIRRVFADVYADAAQAGRIVMDSGLDWTIVYLNRLIDKPATGRARVSTELFARPTSVTRADAAAILLDTAEDPDLAGTRINVSGP
jgi:putative NADH-flavin reductase